MRRSSLMLPREVKVFYPYKVADPVVLLWEVRPAGDQAPPGISGAARSFPEYAGLPSPIRRYLRSSLAPGPQAWSHLVPVRARSCPAAPTLPPYPTQLVAELLPPAHPVRLRFACARYSWE